MGGKKRGAPRQKQRAKEVGEEHLLSITTAGTVIESRKDEDLFVMDSFGDQQLSKNMTKEVKSKNQKNKSRSMPKELGFKVKKIIKTHGSNLSQIESMAKAAKDKRDIATLKRQQRKIKRTNFNLWEDDEGDATTSLLSIDPTHNPNITHKKSIKMVPMTRGLTSSIGGTSSVTLVPQTKAQIQNNPQTVSSSHFGVPSNKLTKFRNHSKSKARPSVAVDVALPGQSYLPDQEQHQDVIGEALTIEIRRKEAEQQKKEPIGGVNGMSDETLAVLINDDGDDSSSDDDDDDDDDDEEDNQKEVKFLPQKTQEKLTTAKRNKQKRVRQQEAASKERKKQKRFLHSLTEVKKINKELTHLDQERLEKNAVLDQLKKEELLKPLGTQLYTKLADVDPLNVPSLPVALTEEIQRGSGGVADPVNNSNNSALYSLRTIRPKGSLLKERLESMADRKMANRKKLRVKKIVQGKRRKPGKGNELLF